MPAFDKAMALALRRPHRPLFHYSRQFSGSATGFFHISKDPSGQYWFIDPDGKALFLCGVDGLTYAGRHCELLGYSPYLKNVQKIM